MLFVYRLTKIKAQGSFTRRYSATSRQNIKLKVNNHRTGTRNGKEMAQLTTRVLLSTEKAGSHLKIKRDPVLCLPRKHICRRPINTMFDGLPL